MQDLFDRLDDDGFEWSRDSLLSMALRLGLPQANTSSSNQSPNADGLCFQGRGTTSPAVKVLICNLHSSYDIPTADSITEELFNLTDMTLNDTHRSKLFGGLASLY